MKTKTLLIAAVMFLSISVAAFAQAQYSVSASPVTTGVNTGVTEKVGDIGFNTIAASAYTVTGTITIDYGRTITADPDSIQIVAFADPDDPGSGLPTLTPTIEDGTKVVITVVPSFSSPVRMYSFRLTGVRVDVSGNTDVSVAVNTVVTATSNMIVNGQATATVLVGTAKPFYGLDNNTVVFNALGELQSSSNVATLDLIENFRYALHVRQVSDTTQTTSQVIRFVLDGTIPAGFTLQFAGSDDDGIWTRVGTGTITSATTNKEVYYSMSADTDITQIEHIYVDVTVTATPALTLGHVYSTEVDQVFALAALGPLASVSATAIPRYAPAYPKDYVKSPHRIFDIEEGFNTTILMIPYATNELGFNTGITIANTTADPGTVAGLTTPLPQTGDITFYFYPNQGDMFSVNSTEVGKELPWGDDGLVPPGKSYILLLTELLEAADYEGDFSGYIIAYCNFSHAHGQYFISDFGSFANGALMLVMNSARATTVPETLGN